MKVSYFIILAVLFVLLSPGILVTLPPGGSKLTVVMTHAVIFVIVYVFAHKLFSHISFNYEPFYEGTNQSQRGKSKGKTTESFQEGARKPSFFSGIRKAFGL